MTSEQQQFLTDTALQNDASTVLTTDSDLSCNKMMHADCNCRLRHNPFYHVYILSYCAQHRLVAHSVQWHSKAISRPALML